MRTATCFPHMILAIHLPSISAITLSQIQPINGFSTACANAYDTPLSGCTATDFSNGDCSTSCISFLNALTQIINAECSGTSAYPNTLMGAFFQNQGTSSLCRNVLDEGSGAGQSGGASYAVSTTGGASMSLVAGTTVTSTTGTVLSSTLAPSSTVQATSILSASAAATTTSEIIAITTVTPNASSSPSNSKSSAIKNSSTSTSSSSTSTSSSSGGGAGANGGGTILDVGANSSCHNAKIEAWVLFLLAGSAGLAWML